MKPRPQTPLVRVMNSAISNLENSREGKNTNDYFLKNFSNFMKQIIDNKNEIFLSGDKNLVKYILSKYLNIPESDLSSLKKLSVIITNDYGLLNQFGTFLPELKLLKLNGSNILSFNDIGTNFNKIECLQMKNCHLKDLDGIICMQNLQILDIENNEVSDLIDIDMCSELKKIVLKNNKIKELDNLTFLSSITNLEYIDLRDNPICESENIDENIESNLNEVKVLIWKKEHEKNIIDIVSEFDDQLIDSVPIRKKENILEKEIKEIVKNEEEDEEEETNDNNSNKNELLSSTVRNLQIKKSKIQIDARNEKNIINPIEKNKIILNNSNSNKNISINSNQNSFRSSLIKNQPLKPIKINKDALNKPIGNNISGIQSDKDKPMSSIKVKLNEDNKNVKINPMNKIKITKNKK